MRRTLLWIALELKTNSIDQEITRLFTINGVGDREKRLQKQLNSLLNAAKAAKREAL